MKASVKKTDTIPTVEHIASVRNIGRKSVNAFTSEEIEKTQYWAKVFWKQLNVKSPFFRAWFGDWRAHEKNKVSALNIQLLPFTERTEAEKYIKNGMKDKTLFRGDVINVDTDFTINVGAQVYKDTLTYANRKYTRDNDIDSYLVRLSILNQIDSIVKDTIHFDSVIASSDKNDYRSFIHKFYNVININGDCYLVKLTVDELNSSDIPIRRAYNVNSIKITPIAVSQVYKPAGTMDVKGETISNISISNLFEIVKRYDNEFNPNPVNPAFLNEDGTPKVYYHGTNADFTVFDRSKRTKKVSLNVMGDGNYFTTRRQGAERYGDNVIEAYLKAQKPYIFRSSEYNTVSMQIEKEFNLEEGIKGSEVQQFLKEKGYDSVVLLENDKAVVVNVFDSEQIKSATDNIGTFDKENKDIRYSRSLTSKTQEFEQYSEKQISNWKNSKRIVIYENNSQFMQFVSRSIDDIMYDKKLYFGVLSEEYAGIIEEKTGINVKGFNCSLSSNEIRKIIRTHGDYAKEQNRGQKAFTKEDFLNIPKVILGADSIRLSDKTYNGKPVIEFSKSGQERFNVAAVVSDKHMDLFVQTAFINIKKGNLAMPTGEQAPINTPEANNGTVSNNIIFENDHNVKKKYSRQRIGSTWEEIRTKMYESEVHEEIIGEIEDHIKSIKKKKLTRETIITDQ
ncbi:MAG: hypothetical protein IJE93_06120 [Clostridia bacterium]|nr:hypothetical protein [Clostridia bacterium]